MLPQLKEESRKRQLSGLNKGVIAPVRPDLDERESGSGRATIQAAKIVGIGKSIIENAATITKRAPELLPQIESGKLSVDKAYKIATGKQAPADAQKQPREKREKRAADIARLARCGNRATQIANELGSRRGLSASFGHRDAWYTIGPGRRRLTVGLPGTGL